MPNTAATPTEADALRRMAGAMNRVHIPATLLHLLLVLLAFLTGNRSFLARIAMLVILFRNKPAMATLAMAGLSGGTDAGRTWRTPLRDWQFSPTGETIEDLAPVLHPRALRRLRRQRAWIGWILRCFPGPGMRRSGQRAPSPCPVFTARAPP